MRRLRGLRAAWGLLCACALVAAAFVPSASKVGAKSSHGGGHGGNGNGVWAAQRPVSYKNLTIFPVRGRDAAGAESYITLDEGIRTGTVVITEKGAGAMARRQSPRGGRTQRVNMVAGDGATVNQLALVNRSGKKLLLLSGEVIVGGKQDRIVEEDRIVPPVSVPIALNVFCVEHGRWQQRETASAGRGAAPVVAPVNQAPKPDGFYSLGAVAHPKLRAAAQDTKQQSEVWKEVSENNQRLGTANSTDTYQEVYSNKKVAGDMQEYIRALEREVLQPGVVGVVVARNGEPVWADVFASSSLFARYWPKLLKSYVVDAMGDYTSDRVPTLAHAQRYLNERGGATSTAGQAGVYHLAKTEHTRYAVFELRDISLPAPLRLHFNKMNR